jgi:hypothetical protein
MVSSNRDRLIGLAGVSPNLVKSMEEEKRIPPTMKAGELLEQLNRIGDIIDQMAVTAAIGNENFL